MTISTSTPNIDIINTTNITPIDILSQFKGGKFRFIAKCTSGWMSCNDVMYDTTNERYFENPSDMLSLYKKGSLQTIQFYPTDGNHWLTVFAKQGNKVKIIDEKILLTVDVATINSLWDKTNLYSQSQYSMVNAKSWADKAFVMNRVSEK